MAVPCIVGRQYRLPGGGEEGGCAGGTLRGYHCNKLGSLPILLCNLHQTSHIDNLILSLVIWSVKGEVYKELNG